MPSFSTSAKITIPATVKVNGKSIKVTSIAPSAFKNMKGLKTVIIGKNVEKIGTTVKCPKAKKAANKKILLKRGLKKTAKFK